VAGVLLASKEPQQWLANAFIQAVAYRGEVARPNSPGEAYQLDAADITGPLDTQIIDACRFVARNMRVAATKDIGRTDYPQFHLGAVFEAIANAVAHRDYSMAGSKIRLRVFSDRLDSIRRGRWRIRWMLLRYHTDRLRETKRSLACWRDFLCRHKLTGCARSERR